jgi:hypothetical protein
VVASGLVLLGAVAGTIAAVGTRGNASPSSPTAASSSFDDVAAGSGAPRAPTPTTPTTPTKSTIRVVTEPRGATVRVDGSPRGKAPLTILVELGRRVLIEAEHDGFEPAKQIITTERDVQTVTISLTTRPIKKAADVQTNAHPPVRPMPSKHTEAPTRSRSSRSFNENDVSGD